MALKKIYISKHQTRTDAPLVQHEYSRFTPLVPIHQLHPTLPLTPRQPVSNKPAPSPPLSQPPIKQLQSTQILAPIPSISTLPEEDEPETEQQEPETKQQEPTPDQHEPKHEH